MKTKNVYLFCFFFLIGSGLFSQAVPTPVETPVCYPCLASFSFRVSLSDSVTGCSDFDNRADAGEVIALEVFISSLNDCCTGPVPRSNFNFYVFTDYAHADYLGSDTTSDYHYYYYYSIRPQAAFGDSLIFDLAAHVFDEAIRDPWITAQYEFPIETDEGAGGAIVRDVSPCEENPAFQPLGYETGNYLISSGLVLDEGYISGWDDGEWIAVEGVVFNHFFDNPYYRKSLISGKCAGSETDISFELHAGTPDGFLLGTFNLSCSGLNGRRCESLTNLNYRYLLANPGPHDIYLVCASRQQGDFLVDKIEFIPVATQPLPSPTPVSFPGDVNTDGKVSITDALLTAQFAVGLATGYPVFNRASADVDGDHEITILDALMIAQCSVGLIEFL